MKIPEKVLKHFQTNSNSSIIALIVVLSIVGLLVLLLSIVYPALLLLALLTVFSVICLSSIIKQRKGTEYEYNKEKAIELKERKKSSKKLTLASGVIYVLIGMIVFPFSKIFSIISILLGALFVYASIKKPTVENENVSTENKQTASKEENAPNENVEKKQIKPMNYNLLENIEDENILVYEYEKDVCNIDIDLTPIFDKGGEYLTFVPEPENAYDAKAVAIYLDDFKLGYVYKGIVQDMIHDWIKRNEKFIGHINKIYKDENKATFKIGFYKPFDNFDSKSFSLTGLKSKCTDDEDTKRYENLFSCDYNEEVEIEYNDEFDKYIVYNGWYKEIGVVSNSVADYIEDAEKYIAVLSDFDLDEDSPKAKIKIFIIK